MEQKSYYLTDADIAEQFMHCGNPLGHIERVEHAATDERPARVLRYLVVGSVRLLSGDVRCPVCGQWVTWHPRDAKPPAC